MNYGRWKRTRVERIFFHKWQSQRIKLNTRSGQFTLLSSERIRDSVWLKVRDTEEKEESARGKSQTRVTREDASSNRMSVDPNLTIDSKRPPAWCCWIWWPSSVLWKSQELVCIWREPGTHQSLKSGTADKPFYGSLSPANRDRLFRLLPYSNNIVRVLPRQGDQPFEI